MVYTDVMMGKPLFLHVFRGSSISRGGMFRDGGHDIVQSRTAFNRLKLHVNSTNSSETQLRTTDTYSSLLREAIKPNSWCMLDETSLIRAISWRSKC